MKGRTKLALASGLVVQMVAKLGHQSHGARKILWEAGKIAGGPKATIGLNHDNHMFFSVTSAAGKHFSTPLVAPEALEGWLLLWCWLEHFSDEHSRLAIAVNGAIVAEAHVRGGTVEDWGYEGLEVTESIAEGIEGLNPVALEIVQVLVAEGTLTRDAFSQILAQLCEYYAVGPFELQGDYS